MAMQRTGIKKNIGIFKRTWDRSTLLRVFAFGFPLFTVIAVFSILELYPMGDKTMLTVDLYHQYCPFLIELRQKILDGGSLFYSWNSGLGTEYYAAFANYSSSPLNILVLLFTSKAVPVFIAFVTALRAGLASLFMSWFLSENDNGRYDLITVIFSASYALCGWFYTDFWNIMWCDGLVLLPLIALGLRRLMKGGRYALYTISLAVLVISNYYVGYFICIFLCLFAPVYYLTVFEPSDDKSKKDRLCFKTFAVSAVRFSVASVIGGLMASFIAFPTYMILQHSSATGGEFTADYNLTGNLFDFLGRLMMAANPNIRNGMANVSVGVVPALLLPLFFTAGEKSGITKRQKIGYGLLILIMYLSFTNRMLNYIWHGFHFPNQIPYRQSFLMCFLLVFVAYLTIRSLRSFSMESITAVCAGAFIFVVLYEKFGQGNEGYVQIGLSLLFILIQGFVLRSIRLNKSGDPRFYGIVLTCTMLAEMFTTTLVGIATVSKNEGFTNYDFYGKNREIIKSHTEEIEGTEGHMSFERTEVFPNNICDIQSVYDVKGMSIFSSTARESFVKYMRNFGFHNNGINGLRNAGLTRVTATILGVRNLATIEETSTVPAIFEKEWDNGEGVVFYGNPDALSVGFVVSDDILDYEPDFGMNDNFAKTNMWVSSMGVPDDVFVPVYAANVDTENALYSGVLGNTLSYSISDDSKASSITVRIDMAEPGADLYIRFDSSKGGRVTVKRDGDEDFSFETRSYQTICLGKFDGRPVTATIRYGTPPTGTIHMNSYQLSVPAYERMVDILSRSQLDVYYYDDTTLKGKIDVKKEGFLLFTIPYTEGFTLYVDGKETELESVQDALCGVHIGEGEHDIVLEYYPASFRSSVIMSAGAFIAFILILIISHMEKKRNAPPAIEEVSVDDGMMVPPDVVEDGESTEDGDSTEDETCGANDENDVISEEDN